MVVRRVGRELYGLLQLADGFVQVANFPKHQAQVFMESRVVRPQAQSFVIGRDGGGMVAG